MANPFSDDVASVGVDRFSNTILQQSGARKRVRNIQGAFRNTFASSKGTEFFPAAAAVELQDAQLVRGALPENTYTAVFGYFQSRGASTTNAATLATLIIDSARLQGVSPIELLESIPGNTALAPSTYPNLNIIRNVGEQQELVSNVNNSQSLKSRSIRA
jgi:hypothetical protein